MIAKQTSRGEPKFTDDELKAIHRELFRMGWQTEAFYTQRKTVIQKLDNYFKEGAGPSAARVEVTQNACFQLCNG